MNNNLTFEEMTALVFGEEQLKKMKEQAEKKAKIAYEKWKNEIQQIMNDLDEKNDIMYNEEAMDMQHTILLDTRDFDKKPTYKEISEKGGITETLPKNPVKLTIEELADYIVNKGRTFKAAYQTGTKKDTFVSSSLVAIDVDNGVKVDGVKTKVAPEHYVSIEDFLKSCEAKNITPALVYTTFSHKENWHRFRAIFQLDKVIKSVSEMDMIYNSIQGMFPEADRAVKSVSMIHGGKDLILLNPEARIKANDYIPANISAATIASMDNKVAHIKEVTRTTKESGAISKDNLITPALIALYGNKTFESYDELKQHLLGINLADLLRVKNPSKFHCIFHNDKKPSAGIIEIDGQYIYNCLGGCENGKKDIFNIIAYIKGFKGSEAEKFVKAQRYLMTALKLKIQDEEWMQAQFTAIRENRLILTQGRINKDVYPALAPRMRYITNLLRAMLDHAEASIMTYPTKSKNGEALFFVSYNQIAQMLDARDTSTIKRQIAELSMIGLINKVSDDEVKEVAPKRYNMSLKYMMDNKLRHTVQYYSIPLWTIDTLLKADSIKAQSNKAGITSKGMTIRAAAAIDKKVSTKVDNVESNYTKSHIDLMTKWTKRTVSRKGAFIKDDFMKYAKKNKIGIKYASSILPVVVSELSLRKATVTNEIIEKYSLSKSSLRKTAFINN